MYVYYVAESIRLSLEWGEEEEEWGDGKKKKKGGQGEGAEGSIPTPSSHTKFPSHTISNGCDLPDHL